MPGSNVSLTILLRRRPAPTALMISTRYAGLQIDSVVFLTLAKWRPRPIGSTAISVFAAVPWQS
jgi:hypothetical protein